MKLTFPIAKSPLSNINNTPKKRNETPNAARPTPISEKKKKINSVSELLHGWVNLRQPNNQKKICRYLEIQ